MVQEINRWLNSDQDYATGVQLYQEHGSSAVLKRMFSNGFSSLCQEKLLLAMKALVPANEPLPEPAAAPKQVKTTSRSSAKEKKPTPAPNPAQEAEFNKLMELRQSLLDERTKKHAILPMVPEGADLLALALRILELVPQIKKLNYVRKHYLEHGCLPEENSKPGIDETDKASLVQHRNNLRTKRSRLKKDPEKATELTELNAEIERLTTLINLK